MPGYIYGYYFFSINIDLATFKLENHVKKLELYNKIKQYLATGNIIIVLSNRPNSNTSVTLYVKTIKQHR